MVDRVKIADVAALAGVSATAVSLVLNNRPGSRLSDDVRQRVHAAAAQLDYRPNPAARSLRMGKTRTIGFVSFDVTITRYASAIIRGALDQAELSDHTVLIAEAGSRADQAARAIDAMLDRRVDALVIAAMRAHQIDLPSELPASLPVVMVNATSTDDRPSVLPDERVAGEQVAQVLIDAGHRRIAVIGVAEELRDPKRSSTVGARYDGIFAALDRAGATAVIPEVGTEWEPEVGYDVSYDLLGSTDLTGVVCLNDRLAFGLYQAASDRGIRIPEDLSVVSFDDDVVATYVRPRLTTAEIPYEAMGRAAVEMVLERSQPAGHRRVAMPLKVRDSVAPVRLAE